jgi:hypothetical protein
MTRFVTSIDMWNLQELLFPFDSMLLSFKWLIGECPASDLTKITSWRMPAQSAVFSAPLGFVEPILSNLTSLHACEPAKTADIDHSQIGLVLDKCTALKQLYYRAYDLSRLEKYLVKQPKLQALAIEIPGMDISPRIKRTAVALIDGLHHRPETLCFLASRYGDFFSHHPDWARGATRIIFGEVRVPGHDSISAHTDWFKQSICAPLDRSWKLRSLGLDPLSVDALPFVAHVIAAFLHVLTDGAGEIYVTIKNHLPLDCPIHIWAAAFSHVMMNFRPLAGGLDPRWIEVARLLHEEIKQKYEVSDPTTLEYFYTWLALALRGPTTAPRLLDWPHSMSGALPSIAEWAIARLEDICVLSMELPTRASFAAHWKIQGFELCLFTGDISDFITPTNASMSAMSFCKLVDAQKRDLVLRMWNRFSLDIMAHFFVPNSKLPFPKSWLEGFTLSQDAIATVLGQAKTLGFTDEELLGRSDVQNYLVHLFSDIGCMRPASLSDGIRSFMLTSADFVSRLYRRVRVHPVVI